MTTDSLAAPESSTFQLSAYKRTLLIGIALWAVFFAVMVLVQFATPDMPDNDGYYHIKLAYLMRTEGLKPDFPYLPLSILNPEEFYDHHFLFHVALIPFTFGDLRVGAKLAAVFFASLTFLTFWWLLRGQKVPHSGLWALGLLAVSEAFLYRMSITRAQSLSLAFLLVGLGWMLQGKYRRLAPLAFVFVWFYDAFPLMLALAGAYTAGVLLVERRLELRPLLFSTLGLVLGMLVNPYFPNNIVFTLRHILPKLGDATEISVGNEWFPYTTAQLLENSPLALAAFALGALALGLSGRRMGVRTTVSFFLALGFGLMLFQARRFIEYFPPFALLFAAFAWAPMLESWAAPAASETAPPLDLPDSAVAPAPAAQPLFFLAMRKLLPALPALALLLVFLPAGLLTFKDAQQSLRAAKPYALFAGASAWLQANTPAGERVFQTDWDDFPRLFYYNTHNTYLIGLDPTYMSIYNQALYDRWVEITRGEVEHPSAEILDRFAARFVVSDLRHGDFMRQAENDPGMREVFRDSGSVVYEVITP